jgi:hypothetical protein
LNDIASILNLLKIYQAVQKLLVGDTQTDRGTYRQTHRRDLISLLSFLESRPKCLFSHFVCSARPGRDADHSPPSSAEVVNE